ncbi:hypothetical protein DPEC_G00183540 [Dallia pectoralis]|uniref:Uncharacterized protein n=1 Tax=Dallia pectoralis TaxID=75939 RepID=A0ACC2GAY2_DALPE|nr:hypothetical protein DPEC_G00183540 [Dallia pectoralis]
MHLYLPPGPDQPGLSQRTSGAGTPVLPVGHTGAACSDTVVCLPATEAYGEGWHDPGVRGVLMKPEEWSAGCAGRAAAVWSRVRPRTQTPLLRTRVGMVENGQGCRWIPVYSRTSDPLRLKGRRASKESL